MSSERIQGRMMCAGLDEDEVYAMNRPDLYLRPWPRYSWTWTKVQYPFLEAEVISPGMDTLEHCLSKITEVITLQVVTFVRIQDGGHFENEYRYNVKANWNKKSCNMSKITNLDLRNPFLFHSGAPRNVFCWSAKVVQLFQRGKFQHFEMTQTMIARPKELKSSLM